MNKNTIIKVKTAVGETDEEEIYAGLCQGMQKVEYQVYLVFIKGWINTLMVAQICTMEMLK